MTSLTRGDFAAFYNQVHGESSGGRIEPFPWQESLLDRVLTRGWPDLIDVPTGLGKTSVIDVALFAAALGAPGARRRIFFVVDRRLIVDEAYRHACRIRDALASASPGSVAGRVARRLRVEGDSEALDVARMRGGVTWSWRWLERPDRHAVVVGTVDQIGSRFLFRGYSRGERLRPIDAGLVGTDSLIVVDEAHLSEPFLTTLREAAARDNTPPEARPTLVSMTAGPGGGDLSVHRISADDERHAVAGRRLGAGKRAHLVEVTGTTQRNNDQQVASTLAQWAEHLAADKPVVGVICNSVARARAVFDLLAADHPGRCVLLTGRIRPVDRDYLLLRWYDSIRAGRSADPDEPLFVCSTQTIEVGADIDLSALVSDSASLAALTQRLGRLNRLGTAPTPAPAVIVHSAVDPAGVYGEARDHTWSWLCGLATPQAFQPGRSVPSLEGAGVDVSPAALFETAPETWAQLRQPQPCTPCLTASHLDAWARSSPAPAPADPPPEPFLHGLQPQAPQVSVAWRNLSGDDEQWRASIELLPPFADESIELPLPAVVRWLTGQPSDVTFGDVEGAPATDDPLTPGRGNRRVVRYRHQQNIEVITATDIRGGDRLIVPTSYGGCDAYGWAPSDPRPVLDVGDLGAGSGDRRATVRLGPTLVAAVAAHDPDLAGHLQDLIKRVEEHRQDERLTSREYCAQIHHMLTARADIVAVLGEQLDRTGDDIPPHLAVLRLLALAKQPIADEHPTLKCVVLTSDIVSFGGDTNPQDPSLTRGQMTLRAHQQAVRHRAEEFARNLHLQPALVTAVGLAALWHDEGKRDPRFQTMLHGGDRSAAAASAAEQPPRVLAKSGMNPLDHDAAREALQRSQYPPGMRHEMLSAQIAHEVLDVPGDVDRDLVLHLIASHHGCNRPLLPPITDPDPVTTIHRDGENIDVDTGRTVDWEAPARFATLTCRYGRWGLARLETIVRLADIWCSAREEQIP
ncbi:type I-U CRISPR-associated helicase/endonuclease Cas3 [Nonomuraea typhae]|uniref:Type I-U CRISPR-associated helicase/endonuclease Cas3 n=1 Tax=Nonomuraea typhae TaxID=2603600 RepID=A0ABW7ZAT7_9ACTN